jgi:hypothetical protein
LIDAIVGWLEIHVPPVEGEKFVVAPMHNTDGPLRAIVGFGRTSTGADSFDTHPVVELVKVNFVDPANIPVTNPELFIEAIVEFDEVQIPPEVGNILVFAPIQIELFPPIDTVGFAFIVIPEDGFEVQPFVSE